MRREGVTGEKDRETRQDLLTEEALWTSQQRVAAFAFYVNFVLSTICVKFLSCAGAVKWRDVLGK